MKKVRIDSGHFKGNANKGQTGYYEYEGVWKISTYLKTILASKGIQVDFTHEYEKDLDLYKRGQLAEGYDVFISEHTNACDQQTQGVEVFYDYLKTTDKEFADKLSLEVSKVMNNPNRDSNIRTFVGTDSKTYNYYGVIRGAAATNCPHIFLIESGYHDNLIDEAFLKVDENLKKIAQAQANVICELLGVVDNVEFDKAKQTIREKAKLEDTTMKYLTDYTYAEPMIISLAKAINGEVIGTPVVEQPKPIEVKPIKKVIYTVTPNQTHLLQGNVKDFGVKIVNKSNKSIEESNVTNGSFFWYLDTAKSQTYSTSIFIQNGNIIQGTANHYYDFGCPQNVFIIYNDNKIEMKKVYFADQLDYKNIRFAMGGVGIRDTSNPNFKYDPASEGFKWGYNKQTKSYVSYADVLRKTNKIVIGYNIAEDKLYILVRPNIIHSSAIGYDLLDLVKDCKFDIACSYDGGGSVFLNNETDMVFYGDGRRIFSIIGWF